jgi:hypothetical protein
VPYDPSSYPPPNTAGNYFVTRTPAHIPGPVVCPDGATKCDACQAAERRDVLAWLTKQGLTRPGESFLDTVKRLAGRA